MLAITSHGKDHENHELLLLTPQEGTTGKTGWQASDTGVQGLELFASTAKRL